MALWLRVTAAIWLVLVAALALTVFLNYAKFESTYSELSRSRFKVLAQNVKAGVESGLAVGLGLGELRTTQQLLERTKAEAAEIRQLMVADLHGNVLFDTEGPSSGQRLPEAQIKAILGTAEASGLWSAVEDGSVVLGMPIINSFDVAVGAAVLRYDRSQVVAVTSNAMRDMLATVLVIVAVLSVVTVPLVMMTFRGVRQTFLNVIGSARAGLPADLLAAGGGAELVEDEETADDLQPAEVLPADAPAVPEAANDSLEAEFGAFIDSAVGTWRRIQAAEATIPADRR